MGRYLLETSRVDEAALLAQVAAICRNGYAIVSLDQRDTTEVYWFHQECRKRQPPLEAHQEPQEFGRWRQIWEARPELYRILATETRILAVCGLHESDDPDTLICGFTGAGVSCAGFGLSKAVKASAILLAKEQNFPWLLTQVRDDNPAMLAINQSLGFVACD